MTAILDPTVERDLLDELRATLARRAFLFDDPTAYLSGVDATIAEVRASVSGVSSQDDRRLVHTV